MELVAFISTEKGTDLIVSFAVCDPDDPMKIHSLTILRTPKYEGILDEWERGATVTFEREEPTDAEDLLRAVDYEPSERRVTIRTDCMAYDLDVRKVDPSELSGMCSVFRQMNFDSNIQLKGL